MTVCNVFPAKDMKKPLPHGGRGRNTKGKDD